MKPLAHRLFEDTSWPFQFARYLTIGSFAFAVDVGSFAGFLRLGWPVFVAVTVSYALALVTHFTLNRYFSFRAFDRAVHFQAANYAIVVVTIYLTTLAIVKLAMTLGASPLEAKIVAVVANIPLGFLGHRYVSFGDGLSALVRRMRGRNS